MKRRDFLAASSLGVAGSLLPGVLHAQQKPCPPPSLSMTSGSAVTASCGDTPAGPAPAWFANLTARSWTTVAHAATVKACFYTPFLSTSGNYGNGNFFDDYSGAAVDQARREMLMVANGGHADYLGNEAYALALWAETPYWYRLNDPTPVASMYYPSTSGTVPAVLKDGRSPSMHTYGLPVHANGRVWFSQQGHVSSGAGSWVSGLMAFNREHAGLPTSSAQPALPWSNDPGPWINLGAMNGSPHAMPGASSNQWSGAVSVFDPVGLCIYTIAPQAPDLDYIRLDTTTGGHNCFEQGRLGSAPPYLGSRRAPVVIHDRAFISATNGVLLYLNEGSATVTFLSVPLMGRNSSTPVWANKVTGPAANVPVKSDGGTAVYHDGAIYFMNWAAYGSRIFKLTLPADLNGDWSNVWSVECDHSTNPAEIRSLMPVGAYAGNGQWGKFNIVRDMGNGAAALVCAAVHDGPVAVYKLA